MMGLRPKVAKTLIKNRIMKYFFNVKNKNKKKKNHQMKVN